MGARPRWNRSSGLIVSVLVGVLAGCSTSPSSAPSGGPSASSGGASSQAPTSGLTEKQLVVDTDFILNSLDPARSAEVTNFVVFYQVYETLLQINPDDLSKPYPSLASSYTRSDDAKTYTFTLRPDARFSDGTAVTADDVVWSFNRAKNIKFATDVTTGYTITATDEHTVVIETEQPNVILPWWVAKGALSILNRKVVEANGGTDAADADASDTAEAFLNATSAGSGPYMIEKADFTTEIRLVPNAHFEGPDPVYTQVIMRNVKAPQQRLNLLNGESQMALDLASSQADGLEADFQVLRIPAPAFLYMAMSNDAAASPITANPDFREAVRYGLNYDGLLALVGEGSIPARGVVFDGSLGALPPDEAPKRDVERAKAALATAGLTNPTVTLEFPSDYSPQGMDFPTLAQAVQADLAEVGITVELVGSSLTPWLDKYRAGNSHFIIGPVQADNPDPSNLGFFYVPGGGGGTNFSNRVHWAVGDHPDFDALVQAAMAAVDDADREAAFQAMQRRMNELGYFAFILQPPQLLVATKDVQNIRQNGFVFLSFYELK